MTYTTHLLGGVAAGLLLAASLGISDEITYAAIAGGAAIGSLLPDIDHSQSTISNKNIGTKLTSSVVSLFFSHRGAIHTPVFTAIVGVLLFTVSASFGNIYTSYAVAGAVVGIISHLVMDTLNPGGIMWLFPISRKRISITKIKTNSIAEKAFAGAFALLIGYFFIGGSFHV